MKKIHMLPALILTVAALSLSLHAEEAVYCFQSGDFSEALTGIYLQELPREGSLRLGSRILRAGDVLTREQAEEMIYCNASEGGGAFSFLPITSQGVLETAGFRIPGKKNQPPVAEDSALETYRNLSNMGTLRVRDPEEDALTITILQQPRRGTVTLGERNTFTYTPKKNKVGEDSFTYQAVDGEGNGSREATVTITILKPSDSPRYQDTMGLSCSYSAEWMKNTGIFMAETLGDSCCFQPEKPVSRGEFLTMLLKTLNIPGEAELTAGMEKIPLWLRPYAAAALRSGLTAGLPNWETFEQTITREEAELLSRNALDLPAGAFSEQIPVWLAEEQTEKAPLTRAQAAELLYAVHSHLR